MSERFPGGIISKTAPVPTGPYETGTAPGIWTLDQQAEFVKQGIWPIAGLTLNYIEDVFSTYLYTGNGSTQTITNGIDLAGEGGLVWQKNRIVGQANTLIDTVRGGSSYLISESTSAAGTGSPFLTFGSTGFSSVNNFQNGSGDTYASWTFRKQPKFFDVVTWSGTGGSRAISHALDSTPGCIIIKRTDSTDAWYTVHRSLPNGFSDYLTLNTTNASVGGSDVSSVGSSTFTVSNYYNGSGSTWVAYVFAHDSGGFGESGEDNVISCGSYTGNGSATGPEITLGYEPQWVLIKRSSGGTAPWILVDTMRGMPVGGADAILYPDQASAEDNADTFIAPTATGFKIEGNLYYANASGSTYIYIAIRRGPMKVPTDGTKVFAPVAYSTSSTSVVNSGFPTDMAIAYYRTLNSGNSGAVSDRLRGSNVTLFSPSTTSESTISGWSNYNASMSGVEVTAASSWANGNSFIWWNFRRAPGFFDEVCYTNPPSNPVDQTRSHNLGVVPTLVITKGRNQPGGWIVLLDSSILGSVRYLQLNTTGAALSGLTYTATATQYTTSFLGNFNETRVDYLFASCPGVSKVGSYTGTAATLQIDCGFTTGARFVLIKRTDSTGDWYVWDSARGIVAGNDPYLLLNTTDAEVTGTDYVDTYSAGFEITSTAPAAINASGGSFIFLAIA